MRILLTGGSGQVGRELLPLLTESVVFSPGREQLDLASENSIVRVVREFRPGIIVNLGAYTRVDDAESHQELVHSINGRAPGVLAELARELDAVLVHYSTDYVFDGTKRAPWVESDPVHPLSVYGTSKLSGERNVAAADGRYLIFRTSWIYGPHGNNFLLTIRRLATEQVALRIVNDQIGAPTSSRQLARATARILRGLENTSRADFPSGIYHLTASGNTSWFGFAEAIVNSLQPKIPLRAQAVLPISTMEFPTPAKRPQNSVLDNGKFTNEFGFQLEEWNVALDEVIRSLYP